MVRNVEKEAIGVKKPIFQSVLPATDEQLDTTAGRMAQGRSFIYHLAEGVDPALRKEFTLLDDHGCVGDGLIGIHSTALTAADFAAWHAAGGGAIVWSPFSNLWLYGGTTDVLAARAAGLRVCLGSDWTPSGTRNVLGELKVAATWNEHALGGALATPTSSRWSPPTRATRSPGRGVFRSAGSCQGALADLAVFANVDDDPWRTVLAPPSATCGWSSSADARRTATCRCSKPPARRTPSRSPSPASGAGS